MLFNKAASVIVSILFLSLTVTAAIPDGYYDSASGSGYTLKTQLYNIISGHTSVSYDALWTHFQTTDADNQFENDGTVLDMYSENPSGSDPYNFTFGSDQCGNYSGEGGCYNREHSFPKSWFDDGTPMYSDMYHLYPTDGKVNGQRSNWPFGEVTAATWTSQNGSKVGPCSYPGYTGTVFEPLDEFKGDFARSYFYMATRYENVISGWSGCDMLDGSANKVFTDWSLNMLLEWSTNDPVSNKELYRNDAIYSIQHNRNPFIDHPEYANYIWGGTPPVPSINFVTASQNVEENIGSKTVTLSISQAIPEAVTANLTFTGSAVSSSDYTISQSSVIFPAGIADNRSITLTILNDVIPEDFETVIVTLSSLTTNNTEIVIGAKNQITFTINNNDGFDETPPSILANQVLNDSTLVLSFSEKLDPITSQTLTNYVVNNGIGNPLQAQLGYSGDSAKVVISFPVFTPGINYQLTVNNTEDRAGNPVAVNTTVDFYITSGTGGGEGWVERYEDGTAFGSYFTGTVTYGTGDWGLVSVFLETTAAASYEGTHALRINDDIANASLTSPAINGVDSVIFYYRTLNTEVSPSTFYLQKSINGGTFTNVQSQTYQVTTYNRFAYKVNDPSDNIRLRVLNNNQAGHLIIDYFKVVTLSGPPVDTTPPAILTHQILNDSTIVLTFSEILDPATSQLVTNYSVSNGIGNPVQALLGYSGDSSKVALSFPVFTPGTNYQLTINNVEDRAGNPIAANTLADFYIPSGTGSGEGWVERFEDGTAFASYYTGIVSYGSGDWVLASVYLETSSAYSYEGTHAVRINDDTANASLTSPAINGVDSVIFYYRTLNSETSPSTFYLQKSVNGGAFANVQSQTYQVTPFNRFAYKVNDPADNIRLRVLNNSQAGHLIIDYFKVVTFPQSLNSPSNVSTQISGSNIVISWDPVLGATKYDVYSSNDPYTGFGLETTVLTAQYSVEFTDTKKFYYIIASTSGIKTAKGENERFVDIKKTRETKYLK